MIRCSWTSLISRGHMVWIMWLCIDLAQSVAAYVMGVIGTKLLDSPLQLQTMAADLYPYEIKGQCDCFSSSFAIAPMSAQLATHQSPLQQTTSVFRFL